MTDAPVAFGQASLTNCDREPIHIPGSIQPHGALLALSPDDLTIVQAGGATAELLGAAPAALLGTPLAGWLSAADFALLQAALPDLTSGTRPRQVFTLAGDAARPAADAMVHRSGALFVLEFEPLVEGAAGDPLMRVQAMIRNVQHAGTALAVCQAIADEVRGVSGFDRVMVYRFLHDGTGAVDAESLKEGLEPYLGLRYPASDIPQQARALYVLNGIRLIPDARYVAAPLVGLPDSAGAALLDLSQAVLRSVSPIHLEYLANMGVAASMSLSIVIDNRLWGLVACHNDTPRFLPHRLRVALELFAQMASFQVETRTTAEDFEIRLRSKTIHQEMVADLAGESDLARGFGRFGTRLLDYIPASGLGLWIGGKYASIGAALPEARAAELVRWLNESMDAGVFHTDRLTDYLPQAANWAPVASGILAVSVSRSPRDYLIWFRPELLQTVTWAGRPEKAEDPATMRLSPRKSFAAWRQEVRLHSAPWSGFDLKTAQSLRTSLLEVVLHHVDQLARERERAHLQQQALLAELDLRIRQWEETALELQVEGARRAVVEAELSQVLRRTVLEQEAERQRIARELHDSLGQYLTVMKLDLDGIGRHAEASEAIRQRIEKLKLLTADAGQEVNHLAWEIRPTALDDLGLQTAFEQYLEEWSERSSLAFDLHLTLSGRRLPNTVETALYRCLQEAIRNVVKHAEASRVGVILEASGDEVRLIVEDDGKGFVWESAGKPAAPSSRLGLLGVRERLALVGGALEVESSPGEGTTLLIHVPL
jgi:light-regulated signal transduction histidine kinase (bacteriophytochrome)